MALGFGFALGFRVGRAVLSGRRALLGQDFVRALSHFEDAARRNPNYVYRSAHFSQGIWTYVGRCQYLAGRYPEARQALELALSKNPDDILARLYLGLTLLRAGDHGSGRLELRRALQGLRDWIEYILTSRSAESYWDPGGKIRSEIDKTLGLMSDADADRAQLLANGEWLGAEMEEEMDRARRDESQGRG